MNKVLKALTLSDLLFIGGWGLLSPIFALFLENDINGTTIAGVGIASAIFLVVKSILQIGVSKFTDKDTGNKREFWTMFIGSMITVIFPLLYLVATDISHIFIIQAFGGIGAALAYPGWMAIFSKFLDNQKEAYEWSIYDTLINLGSAATAAIGGFLAQSFGFNNLFIIISITSLVGTLLLLVIRKSITIKKHA